jgi:hypothetical protein
MMDDGGRAGDGRLLRSYLVPVHGTGTYGRREGGSFRSDGRRAGLKKFVCFILIHNEKTSHRKH